MSKLLERIQAILVIAVLSAGLSRFLSVFRKDSGVGSFMDVLAISTPRRKPGELLNLLNSGKLDEMELADRINVIQDATLALIRPNMSFEETIHVRSFFISTAMSCIAGTIPTA